MLEVVARQPALPAVSPLPFQSLPGLLHKVQGVQFHGYLGAREGAEGVLELLEVVAEAAAVQGPAGSLEGGGSVLLPQDLQGQNGTWDGGRKKLTEDGKVVVPGPSRYRKAPEVGD